MVLTLLRSRPTTPHCLDTRSVTGLQSLCKGRRPVGIMRSSSHCIWLVGPSINDCVHFWTSEGWLGRANSGRTLGQVTERIRSWQAGPRGWCGWGKGQLGWGWNLACWPLKDWHRSSGGESMRRLFLCWWSLASEETEGPLGPECVLCLSLVADQP